jgi:restriction system protein
LESLIAIFTILYAFWPLIIFFGFRVLFKRGYSFFERIRRSANRVFIGWLVWAAFRIYLTAHNQDIFSLIPQPTNDVLFYTLGGITGGISLAFLIHQLRNRRIRLENANTLDELLALSPDDFEAVVAEVFRSYGHEVKISGGSGDHGVDLYVQTTEGEKWIVQCKRYIGSVGEPVVRDLYGTMLHEEAQQAYLITTGSFTQQARTWVSGKPIVLYNGENLIKLIRRTQSAKLRKAI